MLPGCLSTGETLEEAWKNSIDAKYSWIMAALEDGVNITEPKDLYNYSRQFKLRLPKSLHKQLAEQAMVEGISMNQYCLFLLSQNIYRQNHK